MTFAGNAGGAIRHAAEAATRLGAGLHAKSVTAGGFEISFDEGGDPGRPTVLMLHGFSAARDVWARFAIALKDFHLVIPDLPGHGRTPFIPGAGYSAPAQADRLVALLDALGIQRSHVIGNSMGGFIAATLAQRAPERVLTLGLVDAAGVDFPNQSPLGRMLDAGHNPFLMDDPSQFDAFYAMTMAKPPVVPAVVRTSLAEDYVRRRDQLAEIFADFHDQDMLNDHLAEIAAPAWVAWGRRDQLIDVSAASIYADGLPDSALTVYDDLGHMPMLEAPRRSAKDYLEFLARHVS